MSKISFIFNFFDEISRKVPPGSESMTGKINSHQHAKS
jgi:hypothetical protein